MRDEIMRKSRLMHYRNFIMGFGLAIIFSGCAGSQSFVGQTAQQEKKVALMDNGPHEGSWETNDVGIKYVYTNNSKNFDIKGTVKLSSHITTGYTDISGFHVRINFLDKEKTVLDSQVLYSGGQRVPMLTWRYERQFNLPPKAVAFNFSYKGTALDVSGTGERGLGGDGVQWDFWRNP